MNDGDIQLQNHKKNPSESNVSLKNESNENGDLIKKLDKQPSKIIHSIEEKKVHKSENELDNNTTDNEQKKRYRSSTKDETKIKVERWLSENTTSQPADDDVFDDSTKSNNNDKFNKVFQSSTKLERINSKNNNEPNNDKNIDKSSQIKRNNSVVQPRPIEVFSDDEIRNVARKNSRNMVRKLSETRDKPIRLERTDNEYQNVPPLDTEKIRSHIERVNSKRAMQQESKEPPQSSSIQKDVKPTELTEKPTVNDENQKLERVNSRKDSKYLLKENTSEPQIINQKSESSLSHREVQLVQENRSKYNIKSSNKKVEEWLQRTNKNLFDEKQQVQPIKTSVSLENINTNDKTEQIKKAENWVSTSSLDKQLINDKDTETTDKKKQTSESVTTTSIKSNKTEDRLTKPPRGSRNPKYHTYIDTGKQHVFSNWLKDYRKFASKSPRGGRENEIKQDTDIKPALNEGQSVTDKTKPPLERSASNNQNGASNEDVKIELGNTRNSKSYKKRIMLLSIVIGIAACLVFATTTALLVKYLGPTTTNSSTTSSKTCNVRCPNGYTAVSYSSGECACEDTNECQQISKYCFGQGALCTNTEGSYVCSCGVGFKLDPKNNTSCLDINECAINTSLCNFSNTGQICVNTPGSYACVCKNGYEWSAIDFMCVDKDECISNKLVCNNNEYCINTDGSYICNCDSGYTTQNNTTTCVDIDECRMNSENSRCPYPTVCSNTIGSYQCCIPNMVQTNDTCFSCGLQYITPSTKVISGTVSRSNSWPWMVSIGINYKFSFYSTLFQQTVIEWLNVSHVCGGVMISEDAILTAAHCLSTEISVGLMKIQLTPNEFHKTIFSIFTVYVGINSQSIDKLDPNNIFTIKSFTIHENYDPPNYLNDIALIKLTKSVPKTLKTDWICLSRLDNLEYNQQAYVIGFGATSATTPNVGSDVLNQVAINVLPFNNCQLVTVNKTSNESSQLCAGNMLGGKDSCFGDSGSPLMYSYNSRWYVIGLVSYGTSCGLPNYPGIYTNIRYFYDWILDTM